MNIDNRIKLVEEILELVRNENSAEALAILGSAVSTVIHNDFCATNRLAVTRSFADQLINTTQGTDTCLPKH
jgi:uncharacterized protein YejL (UPF0352 family)